MNGVFNYTIKLEVLIVSMVYINRGTNTSTPNSQTTSLVK